VLQPYMLYRVNVVESGIRKTKLNLYCACMKPSFFKICGSPMRMIMSCWLLGNY
jgi:hypothetical protein